MWDKKEALSFFSVIGRREYKSKLDYSNGRLSTHPSNTKRDGPLPVSPENGLFSPLLFLPRVRFKKQARFHHSCLFMTKGEGESHQLARAICMISPFSENFSFAWHLIIPLNFYVQRAMPRKLSLESNDFGFHPNEPANVHNLFNTV